MILKSQICCIKATNKLAHIKLKNGLPVEWTITPDARPDVYELVIPKSTKSKITFFTDVDSITFIVEPKRTYSFVVLLGKDSAYTKIVTRPEPAYFSKKYQSQNNNKTIVENPEVYEMVNIVIALTKKGLSDSDLVNHNTKYYNDIIKYFENFKNDKVVLKVDSILQNQWWRYFYLKMDAYAFEIKKGKIVNGGVYERVNWEYVNTLQPLLSDLQEFYFRTNFSTFYNDHKLLYKQQISYLQDSLNIQGMKNWLSKNFPTTNYNCIKVIYSPLVYGSQSAISFQNNKFSEAQVHVNFPYTDESDMAFSEIENTLRSGSVIFTELNHSYINPEAEKYLTNADFIKAFQELDFWERKDSPAKMAYRNGIKCFEEYLNWSLLSLYIIDNAPKNSQEKLLSRIEYNNQEIRGFLKFKEFNQEFIRLYSQKKTEETVADLFPAIIKWCGKQTTLATKQ